MTDIDNESFELAADIIGWAVSLDSTDIRLRDVPAWALPASYPNHHAGVFGSQLLRLAATDPEGGCDDNLHTRLAMRAQRYGYAAIGGHGFAAAAAVGVPLLAGRVLLLAQFGTAADQDDVRLAGQLGQLDEALYPNGLPGEPDPLAMRIAAEMRRDSKLLGSDLVPLQDEMSRYAMTTGQQHAAALRALLRKASLQARQWRQAGGFGDWLRAAAHSAVEPA